MKYHIQTASYKNIQLMLKWAKNEGWNPGLHDASAFQMIDPMGFHIGYLGNKPISCISTVKYSPDFSFLGLYIVKPEYRGQGFGYKIFKHAMDSALQSNIGLDGAMSQQANYLKAGFHLAHKDIRYVLADHQLQGFSHKNILPAELFPLAILLAYDHKCFPASRDAFLIHWILMKNAKTLVFYDKEIKGYGVIRECQQGYRIGPLFAETAKIASLLFCGLCATIKKAKQKIFLDMPEINKEADILTREFQLQPEFEMARMYTIKTPAYAIDKVFAITASEVG